MAKKTAEISFRIEEELRNRVDRRARLQGKTRPEYLRSIIIADLDLKVDELIALNRSDDDDG